MANVHPRAGLPPDPSQLIDVDDLRARYASETPDPTNPRERVALRHLRPPRLVARGALQRGAHPGDHAGDLRAPRARRASPGRCSSARTRTRCPAPAQRTALEVLAANGVETLVSPRRRLHADAGRSRTRSSTYNRRPHGRARRRHRHHAVAQPAARTAASSTTRPTAAPPTATSPTWIEDARQRAPAHARRASSACRTRRRAARRPRARTTSSRPTSRISPSVVDVEAIARAGVKLGVDPLGGASVRVLGAHRRALRARPRRSSTRRVDPRFALHAARPRRQDPHGLLVARTRWRTWSSSRTASTSPSATTPTPTATASSRRARAHEPEPLPGRRDRLPLRAPPGWPADAAVGKTLVSSSAHRSRRRRARARRCVEVPVGFKWFVDGLLDGSLGFGGEESAGASLPAPRRHASGRPTRTASSWTCSPPRSPRVTGEDPGAALRGPARRVRDARTTRASTRRRRRPRRRALKKLAPDGGDGRRRWPASRSSPS